MKQEEKTSPDVQPGEEDVFNEETLRREIARVWGKHGAHMEVYDTLLAKLAKLAERTPSSSPVEAAGEYAIKKYGEPKVDGDQLAGDTEDGIADFIAGYNFCKSLSIPVSISAKEAAKERYPLKIIAGLTRKESENIFTAMQEAFLSGASWQASQPGEAVEFAEWIVNEDYIPIWPSNKNKGKWRDSKANEFWTSELYQLFTQSKQ